MPILQRFFSLEKTGRRGSLELVLTLSSVRSIIKSSTESVSAPLGSNLAATFSTWKKWTTDIKRRCTIFSIPKIDHAMCLYTHFVRRDTSARCCCIERSFNLCAYGKARVCGHEDPALNFHIHTRGHPPRSEQLLQHKVVVGGDEVVAMDSAFGDCPCEYVHHIL